MEKIKAGVIGVGYLGRFHAQKYAALENAELVGVVDHDFERAQSAAEKHGCRAFRTVDELIGAGIDAASVAVPTTFHRAVAEPLLRADVACLIEKLLHALCVLLDWDRYQSNHHLLDR